MIAAAAWMLTSRAPVELEVTRDRGGLYQTGRGGTIENSYTLKITNRETDAQTYQVTPLGPDGIELLEPIETRVDGLGSRTLPAVVLIPRNSLGDVTTPVEFRVEAASSDASATTETTFIGPGR